MLARIKFEIGGLVREIVERLPAEVFTSTETTFLDPAMAGGQFLVEIIRKLRDNGHSDDNIASRVFGLAEDRLDLNYAQRKNGVIGQLAVGGIETLENYKNMSKKFDVVIGNPPYQDVMDSGERKSKNSNLWSVFLEKAIDELVVDGGYVGLITPPSWMSPNSKVAYIFHDNQIVYVNVSECKKHFPGVGSQFSAYVLKKEPPSQPTDVVCEYKGTIEHATMIFDKSVLFFPFMLTATAMAIFGKTCFASTAKIPVDNKCEIHTSAKGKMFMLEPAGPFQHKTYYTHGKYVYANKQTANFTKKKVLFSEPGYVRAVYDDGTVGTTSSGMFIEVTSANEGHVLVDVLHSKLYQFLTTVAKWNGFNIQKVLNSLPAVDLTRTWTDAELYQHFNLTQEEIDLIEATVK